MSAVVLSLLACLQSNPLVCETVFPPTVAEDGRYMTFFECLGIGGLGASIQWLQEHPQYTYKKHSCTISNDPQKTRERLEDQPV